MTEHHFILPDIGYVVAIAGEKADHLARYPEGTVEVPPRPAAHYEWDGGQWVEGEAPVVPLPDLQPFQFWAMVDISGKRAALEAFAETLPGNQKIVAKAKLQHTLIFRRDNPLVEAARQGIGLTNEELDALWLQAAEIV